MEIAGLQKMTLLDYPGKVACTVFLGGCNFRCPFCHNWELLDGSCPPEMDSAALLAFLRKRQGLLDGVCITGGEPLLHPGLPDLLRDIRRLGYAIKLDTNGSRPDWLRALVEAKLVDYVAMDVKNSPERYPETVGLAALDLQPMQESVAYLLSNAVEYEFRTTVVEELHDDASMRDIGAWIRGARRFFLQPFVDRDSVPTRGLHAPSTQTLTRYAAVLRGFVQSVDIRGI